ncbi:MAG: oxygenase MpaB family protein, partial [Marmoricola sp.]
MSKPDLSLADIIEESMLLLGAGSTVLYQLALLGVGRGVAEHSTTLSRPVDRLRTTLTYVYVMTRGTQEERDAVARMVN